MSPLWILPVVVGLIGVLLVAQQVSVTSGAVRDTVAAVTRAGEVVRDLRRLVGDLRVSAERLRALDRR